MRWRPTLTLSRPFLYFAPLLIPKCLAYGCASPFPPALGLGRQPAAGGAVFRVIGKRRRRIHPKRLVVFAAALVALLATISEGQGPPSSSSGIPQTLVPPGDIKPIQLHAESVSTWVKDGQRAI